MRRRRGHVVQRGRALAGLDARLRRQPRRQVALRRAPHRAARAARTARPARAARCNTRMLASHTFAHLTGTATQFIPLQYNKTKHNFLKTSAKTKINEKILRLHKTNKQRIHAVDINYASSK